MPSPRSTLAVIAVSLLAGAACGADDSGSVLSTTSGVITTGVDGGGDGGGTFVEDSGESGGSDSSSGGEPEPQDPCSFSPQDYGSWPMVAVGEDDLDVSAVCDYAAIVAEDDDHKLHPEDDDFEVWVYRPDDSGWPDEPAHPVVFFVPGNDQFLYEEETTPQSSSDHWYWPLLEEVVRDGYVVVAGQPPGANLSSGKRMSMLACMMLWAQDATNGWDEADNDRIATGATLMGHSRGGSAAWLLTDSFADFQQIMTGMEEYELCSTVALAQRWGPGSQAAAADRTSTNITIDDVDKSVPFLAIQGAIDDDTNGDSISAYDVMVPEDDAVTSDPSTLTPFDKLLVWVFGVRHNDFGGTSGLSTVGELIAERAGPYYVSSFLRWQMFGSDTAREALMTPMRYDAVESDFPDQDPDLQEATLWSGIDPQYEDAGERPLIYADYTQGIEKAGSSRFVVDTLHRSGVTDRNCLDEDAGPLSESTAGTDVIVSGLDTELVCHGPADALTDDPALDYDRHETSALLVEWGDAAPDGYVEWSLVDEDGRAVVDLADYSYLSLRIGNLVEIPSTQSCITTANDDAFTVRVEILSEGGVESAILESDVSVDPQTGVTIFMGECSASQYMRTVRFPLSDFCDQGTLATGLVTAIRVYFDDDAVYHRAMLDSIELTRDPLDPASARCGTGKVGWKCEADPLTLTAIETSCEAEPVPWWDPECDSGDIVTNEVDLPSVALPGQSSWDGWIVHTPAGWIDDAQNPTAGELDWVEALCVRACELEWSDDPHIAADCDSIGAFETPSVVSTTNIGSEHRIAAGQVDGSGIFSSETLSCSLEGDCCLAFDERLCAARPDRPTPATEMLGRGQEYEVTLGGSNTKVTFITPTDSASMALSGTAGYSSCTDGGTCPFYLGSLELSGSTSTEVTGICPDRSSFSVDVEEVELSLLQPAFGIAEAPSVSKGFPRGAMHVLAEFVVDGVPYSIRAVNDAIVLSEADATGLSAENIDIEIAVPCGAGLLPVTIRFEVESTAVEEEPPAVTINVPSQLLCPSMLDFDDVSVSDPDDDLATVRYYIDDVLMAPEVESIDFTGPHELRVVATDLRGGATTETKQVSCIPL